MRGVIWLIPISVIVILGLIQVLSPIQDFSRPKPLQHSLSRKGIFIPWSNGVTITELVNGMLPQNDSRILDYILDELIPPSTLPYNLGHADIDSANGVGGLTPILRNVLKNKKNGFFVEAFSHDKHQYSRTLGFERFDGWTGLLIEPSSIKITHLRAKNRKAWIANVCLSTAPVPYTMDFLHKSGYSVFGDLRIKEENTSAEATSIATSTSDPVVENWTTFKVPCFPLFSLLSAMNLNVVDYFNLGVEGVELDILKTIPFQDVLIKTISVELHETGEERRKNLKSFMESVGYKVELDLHPHYIFSHPSLSQ